MQTPSPRSPRHRARALAGLAACGVASAVFASGAPAASVVQGRLRFLHVRQGPGLAQIVDRQDRSVLLRGVNVPGLRDDYQADGSLRPPYPETPAAYHGGACPAFNPGVYFAPLCRVDAAQLARFGYDVVRLPVSWSQLEPSPGTINSGYIDRIAQVVRWLGRHGIYTVLDMHQDAWSKYLYTPAGAACPPLTQTITG